MLRRQEFGSDRLGATVKKYDELGCRLRQTGRGQRAAAPEAAASSLPSFHGEAAATRPPAAHSPRTHLARPPPMSRVLPGARR